MDKVVGLTRAEIDVSALLREAGDDGCGAVLSFSGTVRDHHQGRSVRALHYEAYEEMAESELRGVVADAGSHWPEVKRIQVIHRLGAMDVGDSSIFITVAAPHRPQGFAALRFVIDEIKRRVPIWKKEIYDDGETRWLHPDEGCCAINAPKSPGLSQGQPADDRSP